MTQEYLMRYCLALGGLIAIVSVSVGQTMTITGTVRDLNGVPLEALDDFTVEAFVGGNPIARGSVTPVAPFVYTINIDPALVNPNDVRVLLSFRATGQTPVDLNQVVGKASAVNATGQLVAVDGRQVIDIVMPKLNTCQPYGPRCLFDCHRKPIWKRLCR